MNLLAHAYLSFRHPEVTIGNMISDFVKGRKQFDYPSGIRTGIILHRNIDTFTDASEATRAAKEFFRPAYRLYSGAFTDIVYDHFLALDPNIFSNDSLLIFSENVYQLLDHNLQFLPPGFAGMYPYMKTHNWLYNYRTKQGIERSFTGLVRRSAYLSDSQTAFQIFEQEYDSLKECYDQLMAGLIPFARQRMDQLLAS